MYWRLLQRHAPLTPHRLPDLDATIDAILDAGDRDAQLRALDDAIAMAMSWQCSSDMGVVSGMMAERCGIPEPEAPRG